jgi:hypothetical protein
MPYIDGEWYSPHAYTGRLRNDLRRAVELAERLHQMVPREVWRCSGAFVEGRYEGEYWAEQILEELEKLKQVSNL